MAVHTLPPYRSFGSPHCQITLACVCRGVIDRWQPGRWRGFPVHEPRCSAVGSSVFRGAPEIAPYTGDNAERCMRVDGTLPFEEAVTTSLTVPSHHDDMFHAVFQRVCGQPLRGHGTVVNAVSKDPCGPASGEVDSRCARPDRGLTTAPPAGKVDNGNTLLLHLISRNGQVPRQSGRRYDQGRRVPGTNKHRCRCVGTGHPREKATHAEPHARSRGDAPATLRKAAREMGFPPRYGYFTMPAP